MKLIICSNCADIKSLRRAAKSICECGESWGQYKQDGINATIGGNAIPLGFSNPSLINAIKNRPKYGMGETFTAFIIPEQCESITKE